MNKDFSSLIGRPYSEMNCWEAARRFYSICFNIELKHYCHETPSDREDIRSLVYSNAGDFEQIKENNSLKFGDIILFKIKGIESHIGIYVGPGIFFHSHKPTGSCIERIDKWKHLLSAAYRIKSEAAP